MSAATVQQALSGVNSVVANYGQADPGVQVGELSGEVVGAEISTIGNILGQKKQNEYNEIYGSLSNSEKQQLNSKMASAQNDVQRLSILSNTILQKKLSGENLKRSNEKKAAILFISVIFVTVIITGIIKRKRIRHGINS